MAKLHEGLAIHKDRSAVVKKVLDEARAVFKAGAHFAGFVKKTEFFDEANARFNQIEEKQVDETVPSKLDYVNGHMRALLDLDFQIERANTSAVADLVLEDQVVATGVPVGFLLTLENKFKEYRAVIEMIPTQAPGIKWEVDTAQRSDGTIFKAARDVITFITKKLPVYQVVVQATPEHPAQVKESHDDVRIAKVTTTPYTATISPAQKSDMLARVDMIVAAAKRAQPLLNYIVHGANPGTPRS